MFIHPVSDLFYSEEGYPWTDGWAIKYPEFADWERDKTSGEWKGDT